MFVATLVASASMGQGDIAQALDRLAQSGCQPGDTLWLDADKAADIFFAADPVAARAALTDLGQGIDIIVQPQATREKALIIADMDSTMITVECIDELADYAGIKPQIAEITERAMRGELDFAGALDERVALLKGLEDSAIDRCAQGRDDVGPSLRMRRRQSDAVGPTPPGILVQVTRFTRPARIAAGALGDAGSPASDSTLGPTSGLNIDGQHHHIWDTVVPTFLHYNLPLLAFGWVAAMVL